jgi:GT2 family glycosyltransferase
MNIGVVVLNWNQADDTIACVQALHHWTMPVDIWIVDNASSDQSVVRIRQACPDATLLVNEQNLGFAGGNNVALRQMIHADYDAVMLLNNDAVVGETAVSQLINAFNQNPHLGIVGPSLWDSDCPDRVLSVGGGDIGLSVNTHLQELPAEGQLQSVAYVPGTCIFNSHRRSPGNWLPG